MRARHIITKSFLAIDYTLNKKMCSRNGHVSVDCFREGISKPNGACFCICTIKAYTINYLPNLELRLCIPANKK